jgi:hypothetical protein
MRADKRVAMLQLKLPLYVKVVYGWIAMFCMIGVITNRREMAAIIFMITAVMWVLMQIVLDALQALIALSILKKTSRDDDNKGPPSHPPTATV